jgi:predicted RNA-binding Zn-ribbon protein involved in translation (DUF1610 family)
MAMPNPKRYYLVVECTSCARFLLATSNKRTRSCPYCGKRVTLEDAKVLARSEEAEEARLALQELKIRKHHSEARDDPKLR